MLTQELVAKTFGFAFLLIGILGFIGNPLVGSDALFETNAAHNLVHLASGALALLAGYASSGTYAKTYNVGFGVVYAIVTLAGFLGVGFVVDLLALNMADNALHLLITAGLLGAGLAAPTASSARTA